VDSEAFLGTSPQVEAGATPVRAGEVEAAVVAQDVRINYINYKENKR